MSEQQKPGSGSRGPRGDIKGSTSKAVAPVPRTDPPPAQPGVGPTGDSKSSTFQAVAPAPNQTSAVPVKRDVKFGVIVAGNEVSAVDTGPKPAPPEENSGSGAEAKPSTDKPGSETAGDAGGKSD